MLVIQLLFWTALGLLILTYALYPLIAYIGAQLKKYREFDWDDNNLPSLSVVIAAYNEEAYIQAKIENTLSLDYPEHKKQIIIVTDGSTDKTNETVRKYPSCQLMFLAERNGKIAAVDRAMQQVSTPLTVLTDANAMLNKEALLKIVRHFKNLEVGAVAGEKKVRSGKEANASGENLYWRYESFLKNMDSKWNSVVGAAGELYAIRTNLYEEVPSDTILDDFMITLQIAKRGFKVAYEPQAYAIESASLNLHEEMKRKIRICAGGFQSIYRLGDLANPLKYGTLSIQYLIHRVFRWTVAPVALIALLLSSLWLTVQGVGLYAVFLGLQMLFYGQALNGLLKADKAKTFPGFYVPLYFVVMHWCVFPGLWRYWRGQQSVNWSKAKRAANLISG